MAKAKKLPSVSWRVQLYIGKDDAVGKAIERYFTETLGKSVSTSGTARKSRRRNSYGN